MNIFDILRADKELEELKKEYFDLTEKYPAFNWHEFKSIEHFKDCIRKEIKEIKEKKTLT